MEQILAERGKQKRKQYLVKWKGYPQWEATWEPEKNVQGAKELVEEFKDKIIQQQSNFQEVQNIGTDIGLNFNDNENVIELELGPMPQRKRVRFADQTSSMASAEKEEVNSCASQSMASIAMMNFHVCV